MSKKAICLYLHVHQPYRIKHYTIFNAGSDHNYFDDSTPGAQTNNEFIVNKIAEKSYLPTNAILKELLDTYPEFKISLSISGTAIEQFEQYAPNVLASFQELVNTGKVEILAETYHHSLAFFYSMPEFETQVTMHREKIQKTFGQTPRVFRNTELSYNNQIAQWAENSGYRGIITEGWDGVLGWRSPNYVYRPVNTSNIRLMMKNYKLSDDMAFRFSDPTWKEYPLTADKYANWLHDAAKDAQTINLFMDYETFGEHQWAETGILDFLKALPKKWLAESSDNTFMTISDAIDNYEPVDEIDVPNTITWADTERDLSAWVGNSMQQQCLNNIYALETPMMQSGDWALIEEWRRMQTSDHFYYMCTKLFNDGNIHAYFSPYSNPYEAFTNFTNAYHDLLFRLTEKGISV